MEAMAPEAAQERELEQNGQVWEQLMQLGDLTPSVEKMIDRLEQRLAKVLTPGLNVVPMDKDAVTPDVVLLASIVRSNNECLQASIERLRQLIDRISI